jgi:hypothetical protein
MAKKTKKGRSAGRSLSGKVVALNPWIPAVPVKRSKGARGKNLLKLILGIPLLLTAGVAAGEPLPNRTLHVPVELTQHWLTVRQFEKLFSARDAILQQYEARIILVAKGGK